MSAVQPKCYNHCGKPAAVGDHFCSRKCAAEYAEEIVIGAEEHWCPVCEAWVGPRIEEPELLVCGHIATELTLGMKHAEASRIYWNARAHAAEQVREERKWN